MLADKVQRLISFYLLNKLLPVSWNPIVG